MESIKSSNEGIVCEQLSHSWHKGPQEDDYVFKNISFSIKKGEFISFIGPSGCGKSTLLNIISGLLKATSGRVIKDNIEVDKANSDMGIVFQDYSLFPWLTVKNNVAFGLKINGKSKEEIAFITEKILKRVGLWDARNKYPYQLSGGMKQRTAIARVLANDSNYLLMDEPFGALDYQTRTNMQHFLKEVHQEFNKTILFVTHHVEEAIALSNRVLLMSVNQQNDIDELTIDFNSKREITSKEFNTYRQHIINHLNKEVKA